MTVAGRSSERCNRGRGRVMARRIAIGQRLVWRPMSRTSPSAVEHCAVGDSVAGRLGRFGRVAGANDDRHPIAVGDRGIGGFLAHRLRCQIDQHPGPQRGGWQPFDAGVAVAGGAQRPVDTAVERRFEQVGVVRGRTTHPAAANRRTCARRAARLTSSFEAAASPPDTSSAAASQWRAVSRNASAPSVEACSTSSGSCSVARSGWRRTQSAAARRCSGREASVAGLSPERRQLRESGALPGPAPQARSGRPGALRRPCRRGQCAIGRPTPVAFELVEHDGRQRVGSIAQLLDLYHHRRQVARWYGSHVK